MIQKDPNKEGLIYTAKINPSVLLDGEKPRLMDILIAFRYNIYDKN